jgi:hypothetical protein
MKRAVLGAAVVAAMMTFAAPALAASDPGFLEICKSSTGLDGTPSFTFNVSGHAPVTVANNSCSRPFAVTPGSVTVSEVPGSFFRVSSISTAPGSALTSSNLATGTATVNVPNSPDPSGTVVLNYTNEPMTGFIEVCKNNAPDAGLTGSFTFTITGNNGFASTVTVPIGHCSFPVQVPAGVVSVAETPPNSVTGITVQNGSPFSTDTGAGSASVTVKASPAPGDTSQEAIVTFANETVQLKICKTASDRGVTAPYTFTAVGSGDPTFPAGITKTVTVRPGQCQLVPGPYTNPNGTTGWRAGTKVTVSEGVVPGTAVTAITVTPASREVAGAKMLSPLPNPTTPGPAGSDAAILGSGETTLDFTNDTEPGGRLKICENVDPKAPAGTTFTFTVSSPTPAGSTTSAAVPMGSCTIVANPVTADGLWLYNSTVTITQVASGFAVVPPITVSPAARLISQSGGTVAVSIGSGDTTVATYTNDPPTTKASSGGGGIIVAVGGMPIGKVPAVGGPKAATKKSYALLSWARLRKFHGHRYLVVRVTSSSKTAKIQIVELNKHGKKILTLTRTVATNRAVRLAVPLSSQVRTIYARLVKR